MTNSQNIEKDGNPSSLNREAREKNPPQVDACKHTSMNKSSGTTVWHCISCPKKWQSVKYKLNKKEQEEWIKNNKGKTMDELTEVLH